MNGDSNRSEASKTLTSVVSAALVLLLCRWFSEKSSRSLTISKIPIAEATPEELIDRVGRVVEAIVFQRLIDLGCGRMQFGHNPASFERRIVSHCRHSAQRCGINSNADSLRRGPHS